jgi:hypothetical protein
MLCRQQDHSVALHPSTGTYMEKKETDRKAEHSIHVKQVKYFVMTQE